MNYKTLVNRLKKKLDAIDRMANDDADRAAILKSVWAIGQDVDKYTRESGMTVKNIALDIGSPEGSLQKYVRFYRVYAKGYVNEIKGKPVTWSHYAAILYIHNKKERNFYLREAARQGWSSHELRRRIRNNYFENRQEAGSPKGKRKKKLKVKKQKLYTYAAEVLRVTDADTFKLNIDVGFSTKMQHKVRLRGINCPELKTKKGEEAKKFVEKELQVGEFQVKRVKGTGKRAKSIVVIRTYRSGKFGRYIVDLWYLKGETNKEVILQKGKLLNQVLLDKGFARLVE